MQFENIALIAAAEVALVLFVFCVFLFVQNRSLRKLLKKLQQRMTELVQQLKEAKANGQTTENVSQEDPSSYVNYIDEQLVDTKEHHASLNPDQDIVLDLAPDTQIPRRTAALRHAVLLAEKEAFSSFIDVEDAPDWSILRKKYNQIFEFYEDYGEPATASVDNEEINNLNDELVNAKKRINNLEKFKALYFDLEAKWESSKEQAQIHYDDLNKMASSVSDETKFRGLLERYQSSYNDFDNIIAGGIDAAETTTTETSLDSTGELRHLRLVAADQHRIITDLQTQLKAANTEDERNNVIDGLKAELDKQKAFVQESETCIQLMEDELQMKNREIEQLTDRVKTLPGIKTQLREIRKQKDEYEIKIYSLTSDNKKLSKKLRDERGSLVVDNGETAKLKKELRDLEDRYTNLEEKYLDLKLNQ